MSANAPRCLTDLSPAARSLARLVPGVYFAKNEALENRPLFPLLEVLSAPLAELERAIQQLRDDHFVERASAEALALIAELVGARLLGSDTRTNRGIVVRTLHWRRRKGTLRTLEDVLTVTSGWSTEVDEAFRSLLHTQDLANLVPWRGRTAVLWDPIALADPLSRRAPYAEHRRGGEVRREPLVDRQPGESTEDVLRRLGRADAGRHAASPRTIDFTGWAQPENAVIRTSRFIHAELDQVEIGIVREVAHESDPNVRFVGIHLDPQGRDLPLAGRQLIERPDLIPALTERHEPAPPAPAPAYRHGMLTPTALAADGDAAEAADNLSLFVDGVRVIGQDTTVVPDEKLAFSPIGPRVVLRFADVDRPSPADEWDLQLVAIDNALSIPQNVATAAGTVNPSVQDENPAVVWTVARKGDQDPEQTGAATQVPRGGADLAVRIARRNLEVGYERDSAGTWSTFKIGVRQGEPLSPVVLLDDGGDAVVARFERRPQGDLGIATWRREATETGWEQHPVDLSGLVDGDRPDITASMDGPALGTVVFNDSLLLVAPLVEGDSMGLWRVDGPTGANPTATRIDLPGGVRPEARMCPALCVHQGSLFLHGGASDGHISRDLWSLPLTGSDTGRWRPRRVRNRQARVGSRLLSTPQGLVLIGGASVLGELDVSVWRVDVSLTRAHWEELPSLPVEAERPGTLWARVEGNDLRVLAWSDHVWPQPLRWTEGSLEWEVGPEERQDAPNPPAEGEALFRDDQFLVVGPPPLPASEILFTMGGEGHLAFLPAVDLSRNDEFRLFFVSRDGSTRRWFRPGQPARSSLRISAGREAPTLGRREHQRRIGSPGRLKWRSLRLRQRSLGPWKDPVALDLPDTVALDPRLGRVLLHRALLSSELARSRVSASYRIGRAAAIGAGFAPISRTVDQSWREPEDPGRPERFEVLTPPDLDQGRPGGPAAVSAWISPIKAGSSHDGVPIVATPSEGVSQGESEHILVILKSPHLDSSRIVIGQSEILSLSPDATGSVPHFSADDGVSVSLCERLEPGADPDLGPTCFLSGLSLEGCLEVVMSAGEVDVRWCNLGGPGRAGVLVAGAGHQSPLARRTLPEARLTVRLYGCLVGQLELPPWVQVIAAGCTFDVGRPDQVAIRAAGARLRLRHCTVLGRTVAGVLQASSCAFKGHLVCDRPDLSWARYSLLPEGGRPPLLYRSLTHPISFASIRATDPHYLVLDDNNGPLALAAAERRRVPGAHAERTQRLLELTARASDYLPMAMAPYHIDRATFDLFRMKRSTP